PNLPVSVSVSASPSSTICAGTNVTFTATPTNGGTTPAYQWKINGVNVGTNSTTYSNSSLSNGDLVTCVLTSNATCATGNPATSNTVTMTVNPNLPVSVSIAASSGSPICSGTNVTFTATPTNGGTTPAYQWQLNGTNVGINSSTYSNATLSTGDIISCVLTSNASCVISSTATSNTISFTVTVSGTWLGSVSNNWNAAGNWCGGVPSSGIDVVIPAGTTFSPQLSSNSSCKGLTINAGATLDMSNFSISLKGNFINSGTFIEGGGTVIFNGAATQTISTTNPMSFNNLTINNPAGVSLASGVFSLDGALTATSGVFNTNGKNFTMTSSAAKTARIAPITGTGSISGNFTVQRFISARDTTYADLASPVQSSTFLDWNNELFLSYLYVAGYEKPSAYTYDETADAYVPVTSSSTALVPGKGYEVFLAGNSSYASLPNTTMDVVGVPNQGDKNLSSFISNNVQGWNLVGNPFASSISWANIYSASGSAASGLYDYFEMYDYTIADWAGYTSASGVEIGSAQGFWVYGLPGATSLTLIVPETSKTTSTSSSIKSLAAGDPYFTLKMSNTAPGNKISHTFKVTTNASSSNHLDNNDLPFRYSLNKTTPALYCVIDGKKSNVNSFNSNDDSYSIPLKTEVGADASYKIEAAGFDFVSDYTCIKLEDKKLNNITDLTQSNTYVFNMNTNDNADRFVLHFSKDANCSGFVASSNVETNIENEISIVRTDEGNLVNFSLTENTPATIEVLNMLGQELVPAKAVIANVEPEKVVLPSGYSGIYIIKVSSAKGAIVKKFYK
ncbi:MAG: T9SS type A sorting domain-containing protein, partial [Bacteroidia bacterium]